MTELVYTRNRIYPGRFVYSLVNAVIGIIGAALALRFLLELLGASASSPFVAVVYEITERLLGPFAGAFPDLYLGTGLVIDVTVIVAMIGYAILGWLIIRILEFIIESTWMV